MKKYFILFEQGIMSLLNFSLIFILSKLMAPLLFKDFFLGYSIVIIFCLITSSFANQPLQIFLKKNENNINYIAKVFVMNVVIIFLISIIGFFIIKHYYTFLFVSLPYILILSLIISTFDVIRRVSFVYFQDNFLQNSISSFFIFFTFFTLIGVDYYFHKSLQINDIYIYLTIAYSVGVSLFFLLKKEEIKTKIILKRKKNDITYIELFEKHNKYALWLVFGIVFFWFYTQGVYFLAEKYISVDDFNAVRVSQNLVGVLSILFVTYENVMLTKIVYVFDKINFMKVNSFVNRSIKKNILLLIGVVLLTGLLTSIIYKIYYHDNEFYSDRIIYLIYFFLYQFVFGLSRIFVVALKAMNQTKYIFYSHFITFIFTMITGFILLKNINNGHVLALIILISINIFSIGVFLSYKKVIKNQFKLNGST